MNSAAQLHAEVDEAGQDFFERALESGAAVLDENSGRDPFFEPELRQKSLFEILRNPRMVLEHSTDEFKKTAILAGLFVGVVAVHVTVAVLLSPEIAFSALFAVSGLVVLKFSMPLDDLDDLTALGISVVLLGAAVYVHLNPPF